MIVALLKQNNFNSVNKKKIITALELAKYQQSNFDALDMAVKRIAYQFNKSLFSDLDEYQIESEKRSNSHQDLSQCEDPSILPALPPLTPKQEQLATKFKKEVADYLKKLPCFTTHLSIKEQKQVISDFEYWIDNHNGTPDKLSERKALLNIQYMAEYLINNFNVIKVKNGDITDLAYWNGETYLTGEAEFNILIKKINLLTYNNINIKDCRKVVTTKDVCEQLEVMTETKDIAPASFIPCLNGIVHFDDNQQDSPKYNLSLLSFTPDIITIYQYQGNYKTVSEIPQTVRNKVNRYFDLICNKDNETPQHYQEIRDRIFEYCSTILYRGQLFKSYGFLHGGADAGKTKFLENCIFSILPPNTFSKVKLNELIDRFRSNRLKGALANLSDEKNLSYGVKGEEEQEALKEVVSGSKKMLAEDKNVKSYYFRCEARIFIALNYYMNLTDEATAKKMVYIPMKGSLDNVDASRFYVDENCSQDEKDYIFITLLGYLQQVFKNRTQTGKYFRQSKYIDSLQISAEAETNDLVELLQNWIDETKPFEDYPIGELMNQSNFNQMKLNHYELKFDRYLSTLPENKQIKVSAGVFKNKLLKLIGDKYIYVDSAKDTDFRASGVKGVLLPKKYNDHYISSYRDYKEQILLEKRLLAKRNNIIDLNTDKTVKEIQDQNLSNPFCK